MKYNSAKTPPLYDGRYLCVVRITQPCGTTWLQERIADRYMGEWVVGEGGVVEEWMPLPYGGWPKQVEPT
jgi:hypothetical protein